MLKRIGIQSLFALIFVLIPWPAAAGDFSGEVTRVLDGDVIEVKRESRAVRVRLAGVDCPDYGQPFCTKAREFTAFLVFGKLVTVKEVKTDRFHRIFADIQLLDGSNLNRELVRAGYAWWSRESAPHDLTLEKLQEEARAAQRGLWAGEDPLPPWIWRKR